MSEDDTPALAEKNSSRFGRFITLLSNNFVSTVFGGLLLLIIGPLVTGFMDLTFQAKSWEVFGISNEASTPGSYLNTDAVYRLPLGERFRAEGDFLLSAYWKYGNPYASLTAENGVTRERRLSSSQSLSVEGQCEQISVHLMRYPEEGDDQFFIMYTSQDLQKDECRGFWSRLFGR